MLKLKTHCVVLNLGDGADELGRLVDGHGDVGDGGAEVGLALPVVHGHEGRVPLAPRMRLGVARLRSGQKGRSQQDQHRLNSVHVVHFTVVDKNCYKL